MYLKILLGLSLNKQVCLLMINLKELFKALNLFDGYYI